LSAFGGWHWIVKSCGRVPVLKSVSFTVDEFSIVMLEEVEPLSGPPTEYAVSLTVRSITWVPPLVPF